MMAARDKEHTVWVSGVGGRQQERFDSTICHSPQSELDVMIAKFATDLSIRYYRPFSRVQITKILNTLLASDQLQNWASQSSQGHWLSPFASWAVTPCGLVVRHQRFRGKCCLRLQGWSEHGVITTIPVINFFERQLNPRSPSGAISHVDVKKAIGIGYECDRICSIQIKTNEARNSYQAISFVLQFFRTMSSWIIQSQPNGCCG
jgi:hypothetical protein